jgi:capsular exopolysaccharide synthesis family protein
VKHVEYLNVPNSGQASDSRPFDEPSNLIYVLSVFKRRKYLLLAGLIAGLIGGSVYFVIVEPKYTAMVSIYIDNPGKNSSAKNADASEAVDNAEIDSQVEFIRSSQVAEAMAKNLAPVFREELARDFAPRRPAPGFVSGAAALEKDQKERRFDLSRIMRALSVNRVERTYVLDINFTAKSPTLAAAVANAFADAYGTVLNDRYLDGQRLRAKWIGERVAEVREALLQADKEVQTFRLPPVVGELDAAKRELELRTENYRRLYQSLLEQQEALSQQSPPGQFQVITPGDPLTAHRSPRLSVLAMLSVGVGLGVGAVAAALREMSDRSFRTRGQVEESLGARFIGWLPIIKTKPRRRFFGRGHVNGDLESCLESTPVLRFSIDEPQSCYAETLRGIRTRVSLLPSKNESKVVGIVSALPSEGKSTLTVNLGRLLASEGMRSLVIDGDLSKCGLSRILVPSTEQGLYQLLGDSPARPRLQDVFIEDRTSGMFFLPIGESGESLCRLGPKLAHKFGATLTEARDLFDIILIDLPPLAAVADARSLMPPCDCFVLIAEWGRTHRGAVRKFLESETEIMERLLGVVLNKVDLGRLRQYEQSHDPQYYPYRKFFSDASRHQRLTW